MIREEQIRKIVSREGKEWDVVVIGGGATGLGVAVDAASRGYSTLLLEKDDFAKATSSRSTKLVHGGVRYLQQGNVKLVLEALRERGRMKKNAPHLVTDQAFVISNYHWWENLLYFAGLTLYDILSFGFGYGRSRFITPQTVRKYLPTVKRKGLKGGIVYHDGQFDDARMAVNLAQTVVDLGGVVLNYAEVTDITHDSQGKVNGLRFTDRESGVANVVKAHVVVNATGIFADDILKMDEPEVKKLIKPSQGVHIVLDRKFLQSDYAIMVPKTSDGRVLFAIPWHNEVVVGTTDTPREHPESEPHYLEEEVNFILQTAGLYMNPAPTRKDIKAVFAGQRPLAAPQEEGKKTKEISRSHKIFVSENGLITITGGKWTSYRRMAEDTVDRAISMGQLPKRRSVTKTLPVHGHRQNPDLSNHRYVYGSDEDKIKELENAHPEYTERLSEKYDYRVSEVIWAVRHEMARTVDDVLSRRVRLLFLDAQEAIVIAPKVADILARELFKDDKWKSRQISDFKQIASKYLV